MRKLTVTEKAPLVPTAPALTQEAPSVPSTPALTQEAPSVPSTLALTQEAPSALSAPAPTEKTRIAPKITYLFNNTDPGVSTQPADMVDFCNSLPQRHHPREMYISKSANQPLKPFFDHFLETRVKDASIKWDIGYALCIIWKLADGKIVHKKQQCNTTNYGKVDYIMTTNYTDFEQADIVYFDYPFWDNIDKPPYIDLANMPPRISHQKWVLWWNGESIV
ncbi:hypothetical protein BGZ74_004256 [Mortierella antarctica]|nr:hypothetical protein BGZ74_004256 [Mortierella antarctica]